MYVVRLLNGYSLWLCSVSYFERKLSCMASFDSQLGIFLQDNLKLAVHIDHVTTTSSSSFYAIRKLTHDFSSSSIYNVTRATACGGMTTLWCHINCRYYYN